jgi:rhodanese-related sulfurtransferase
MNRNNIIVIVLGILIIGGFGYFTTMNTKQDSVVVSEEHHDDDEVKNYEIYPGIVAEKITNNEDVIILDVRTPEEYEELHLKNALLLPVQELSGQSLASIGLGEDVKDKEIIIYCRSGARSKTAYDIMDSLGYTNIKSVSGGMIHWEEDQYPHTESGPYAGQTYSQTNADNEDAESGGPRVVVEDPFHDFGVIPQYGGVVKKDFAVKNEGSETLIVGDITTSCSCTSAQISQTEIPAGGRATLTVVFDPDFHEEPLGVFKRTVFIPTNDPTMSEAEVVIQTDIAEGE